MKAIIFQNDEGGVSIAHPAPNCKLTIEQIAAKSVPAGKPYKIVDKSEIPTDRTFRNAWYVDESELTDGVGLSQEEFEKMLELQNNNLES